MENKDLMKKYMNEPVYTTVDPEDVKKDYNKGLNIKQISKIYGIPTGKVKEYVR